MCEILHPYSLSHIHPPSLPLQHLVMEYPELSFSQEVQSPSLRTGNPIERLLLTSPIESVSEMQCSLHDLQSLLKTPVFPKFYADS